MKYVFATLLILAVVFIVRSLFFSTSANAATGNFSDIGPYFNALSDAKNNNAFLVVTIKGTEDFFQFKHYEDGTFEIDFPLITERQQSLEDRVKTAHSDLGLSYELTESSDGSRFIDVYTKMTSEEISGAVKDLFRKVFLSTQATELTFHWDGFDLPDPANPQI